MNIQTFFSLENGYLTINREQASGFAKGVAGDFNPIHDPDAKKFCVPGDLLFATVLNQFGVSSSMRFEFEGMVNDNTRLILPESGLEQFSLCDDGGKSYLSVEMTGNHAPAGVAWIMDLAEHYVQFSGRAFPHILVELMQQEGVMINPTRPLVIYRNMLIELDRFVDKGPITLELTQATLSTEGKKGMVTLAFRIMANGEEMGHGTKNMLLSGLREYDQSQIDQVVADYNASKQRYLDQA